MEGPSEIVAAVHKVTDSLAARIVTEMLSSPRVQDALKRTSTMHATLTTHLAASGGPSLSRDPALEAAAALDLDVGMGMEFGVGVTADMGGNKSRGGAGGGKDAAADPPVAVPGKLSQNLMQWTSQLDALMDELALVSQRCVSYFRLLRGKAAELSSQMGQSQATTSDKPVINTGSGQQSIPGQQPADAAMHRFRELGKTQAELAGVYCALESALLAHRLGVALAVECVEADEAADVSLRTPETALDLLPVRVLCGASPHSEAMDSAAVEESAPHGILTSFATNAAYVIHVRHTVRNRLLPSPPPFPTDHPLARPRHPRHPHLQEVLDEGTHPASKSYCFSLT